MNKKRLLSLILSLCMVFSIMQTNVFALRHYNTGECGALLDNGVLTISGAGKTYDHNNYFPQPWLTQIDTIHTVIINDEVTGIGNNTFKYMRALKNVTIGKNVSELGVNAFLGCENLENIYWNATSIKDLNEKNTIFLECGTSSNGITITFGKNVDYIPAKTFWCETAPKIKKVIFNGPVEIGYSAFALCDKMEVHISSITDWCQSKFKNTDSNPLMAGSSLYLNRTIVKDLKTPNTLKEINENTFMGCTDLETVTIKDGLTKIGSGAFYDCLNLKKIYLPKSLTNIGKYAFDIGRSKNLDIYYAGTEAEWNAISKNNYLDTDFVNLTMHYNEIYEKKDFEGLTLENKEYTYDGTEKELLVSGNLPAGTTIEYENNKATNAGTYNATAIVKALGYYDLSLSATLKINPKELTITGLMAQNKSYDGTDRATLSESTLNGVISGDDVTANIPTEGKFADKNVGTNKAVTIDTIALSGEKSGNYTLTQPAGLKANIAQKEISVIADNQQIKLGDAIPKLTYQADDLIEPDKFSGELVVATDGKTVNDFDITQGTLTAGDNYKINYTKGILSVTDKTPQTITVADFGEKTYGDSAFSVSVTPDTTSNLSNFTYASDNEKVATVSATGEITIVGAGEANITVTDPGNADYAQATATKKLTVAKKALNIKVDPINITYGEEITPNISYDGFITGENETVLTKPVVISGYSTKPRFGEYDIVLSGAEAANYEISYTGAKLNVAKKDITVSELKVFDKAADETTIATINDSTLKFTGMLLGDDVSIDLENAVANFAQADVGDDIAVNITGLALSGADALNYNLTNTTFDTTANIKASVTAADIAEQISNTLSAVTDSKEIRLPKVPAGYKIVVKSSNNEDVIKADGSIAPVESNTDVKLTFSIVNENDETDVAETGEITVTVPASTKVNVTVTAEANGTVTGSGEYLKNANVTVVATPDSGYKFSGWYTDKTLKTKYDFSEKITKGFTLYAAWTERKAEIKDDNTEPTTPENKITFTDVKENDWFAENVKYVIENGLMNGVSETEFAPNDNLTRAMLVAILYRAAGEPAVNKSIPFADVVADSYYANAVIRAQQNGIVSGANENEFAPDENITREQIATIIYRYAKAIGYDMSMGENTNILSYTDCEEISEYAIEAMQYAVASGLIKGKTETTLNPQDNATRAEIAAILQRFIEANK